MISYALYEIQGTDLVVSEMNYQDGDTYQILLNFIAAHSSMVERFILKDYSNFYQGPLEPDEMNVHVESLTVNTLSLSTRLKMSLERFLLRLKMTFFNQITAFGK